MGQVGIGSGSLFRVDRHFRPTRAAAFLPTMQAATTVSCGRATDYALADIIGYVGGRSAMKVTMTDTLYHADERGGLALWTKLSFPLGCRAAAKKSSSVQGKVRVS